MKRTISSPVTFIYKVIFPSVWIGGFGLGTVLMFLLSDDRAWGWMSLIALCLGTGGLSFLCFPLKTVEIAGDDLAISNFFKTIKVPLSRISDVTECRWINSHPVWVHFKETTEFGTKIMFMPGGRVWPFTAHPIVRELKRLSQEHDSPM